MVFGQVGFLILNSIPLGQLGEAACPFTTDTTKKWKNKALQESANLGLPNYTVAKVGSGFNRTLNLDGFCNNIIWVSDNFQCAKKTNEWHASVKQQTGVLLKFDNADCALHGVTVSKTKPGSDFEAELRLQFFPCQARTGSSPPPVSAAGIRIGLQKEGIPTHRGNGPNLMHWMKEVCSVKPTARSHESSTISEETHVNLTQIGNGTCDSITEATKLETIATADTQSACKGACAAAFKKAKLLQLSDKECTGFAFKADGKPHEKCILYAGKIHVAQSRRLTDSDSSSQDSSGIPWDCHAVTVSSVVHAEATPAPVGYEQYALEKALVEELRLKDVMGGTRESMQEAILHQIDPPEPFCYESTWWFTLQDEAGTPKHIELNREHWEGMMMLLPEYEHEIVPVDSIITIDRVLVKTCTNSTGWGRTCVMPQGRKTCDSVQMINGIITGFATPILSWLFVYVIYKQFGGKAPELGPEAPKTDPKCSPMVVIVCCMAALISANIISYGLSTLIEKFLGAHCAHGSREHMVVWLGSGGAASVAMIIAILYLFKSSRTQAQVQAEQDQSGGPPKGQKYAFVQNDQIVHPHIDHIVMDTTPGNMGTAMSSGSGAPFMSTR
jgi:hypothetical protein